VTPLLRTPESQDPTYKTAYQEIAIKNFKSRNHNQELQNITSQDKEQDFKKSRICFKCLDA
jgi:hypothetical protein